MKEDVFCNAERVDSWVLPGRGKVVFITVKCGKRGPDRILGESGDELLLRERGESLRRLKNRCLEAFGPGTYVLAD